MEKKLLSACAVAWCGSAVGRRICPQQWEAGSRSWCPVSTHNDNVMRFQAKNVYLSLSTTNGGSSQSQHIIVTSLWLLNSFWGHIWISVVSLCQTSLYTHSTVGETPPWQCNDGSCGLNWTAYAADMCYSNRLSRCNSRIWNSYYTYSNKLAEINLYK